MKSFNYYLRLLATGYNFTFFGLGGLLLALTVLPLVRLIPGSDDKKNERARRVIHLTFRYFVWQMRTTGVISLELHEIAKLQASAGKLIIANHPTLIDVVVLVSLLPKSCCVVKEDLFKNPLLRGVVRATGYINNSVAPDQLLKSCRETLAAGYSIVIFPEGTRTKPGHELKFQRGASHIAVRCEADIVPVVISCEPAMLRKGERWYQIPSRRAHICLRATDSLTVGDITGVCASPALATRRLNRHLEDFYRGSFANA